MLNQALIVGHIKELTANSMLVAIDHPYKKDKKSLIDVYFDGSNILNNVREHTLPNDIVGVKGYLIVENGLLKLIGTKVTFLSHSNVEEVN